MTAAAVATTRNLFGFREGAGNPDPGDRALMDRLVWVQPDEDEPAWTAGGSYQVVRLIRFATPLWDAELVEHQEDVFGRHKQTGAPLAGTREDQMPNFAVDPDGRITPLDAHIRRANPRTQQTDANRILRRSYSYRRGHNDASGQPDEGLIFVCFQQDLERGFATIQGRLRVRRWRNTCCRSAVATSTCCPPPHPAAISASSSSRRPSSRCNHGRSARRAATGWWMPRLGGWAIAPTWIAATSLPWPTSATIAACGN